MKRLILTLTAVLVLSIASAGEPSGSLWTNKTVRGGMFADKIARDIGDILTIVVQEESEVSTSKSSSVNKESSISTQIQRLLDNADEAYPGLAWEVA
ncbi:MAG TPA: flagellar basal body L-ring protein FlgH, partial [Oceanipulchritudo sp.]|nr:flagellar basal body L-ring protein FlgH [Oceanipulchritudo sp.]